MERTHVCKYSAPKFVLEKFLLDPDAPCPLGHDGTRCETCDLLCKYGKCPDGHKRICEFCDEDIIGDKCKFGHDSTICLICQCPNVNGACPHDCEKKFNDSLQNISEPGNSNADVEKENNFNNINEDEIETCSICRLVKYDKICIKGHDGSRCHCCKAYRINGICPRGDASAICRVTTCNICHHSWNYCTCIASGRVFTCNKCYGWSNNEYCPCP
ncbi:hypothetical protein QLL95_gp0542 [Cotonvirus japonicus]|uniref:Uncharacterized protein n=1 Tax=Cotonvirus japonicus TaxID=2811091 RepID=A0ABM7NU41_9VIRU|nr:hypothetical protein QLL95_gp0542 [Cotonvirus japonicus]BCS83581.1 hypothetical protein [Cotonvirus japonicus]